MSTDGTADAILIKIDTDKIWSLYLLWVAMDILKVIKFDDLSCKKCYL